MYFRIPLLVLLFMIHLLQALSSFLFPFACGDIPQRGYSHQSTVRSLKQFLFAQPVKVR